MPLDKTLRNFVIDEFLIALRVKAVGVVPKIFGIRFYEIDFERVFLAHKTFTKITIWLVFDALSDGSKKVLRKNNL